MMEIIVTKKPWWKEPIAWMLFSGPIVVVFAAIYTAHLAAKGADKELSVSADYYGVSSKMDKSTLPAMKGRNHAATPEEDLPK